jgi:glycosyltransferase involved in cell wall biosynthesis
MSVGKPLVSVICLCHNHARFVAEALQSVFRQTYTHWELVVVDDGSRDESVACIQKEIGNREEIKTLFIPKAVGHCKAFNRALALTTGAYVIDLAADDVLLPERLQSGVESLLRTGCGVQFTDADWMSEDGMHLYTHSDRFPHATIPTGHIYKELIGRYFICPPTLMMARTVLDALHGYDESLSYEDFDFWIRSARDFSYDYLPQVLVKKRVVRTSQGRKQFQLFSRYSRSTYAVCRKIMKLNRTRDEQEALSARVWYEMKVNARLLNFGMVKKYFTLWNKNRELVYSS